jgi:NADH/F420H2 dehydrogenase subunit C
MQPARPFSRYQNRAGQDARASLTRDLAPLEQYTNRKPVISVIRGDICNLDVERAHLLTVCRFLRDQLNFSLLSSISGVDMLDHLETVYHVHELTHKRILQLRVYIDKQHPEVESIVSVWPGANWLEREVYDLFGIRFPGHPDLRRILLDDEFAGYPLLKEFQAMPPVVKDRATTQSSPTMAITDQFQIQGYEQGASVKVSQGIEERLHPGTPTFGDTQQSSAHESQK